jgi:hypothetical protein
LLAALQSGRQFLRSRQILRILQAKSDRWPIQGVHLTKGEDQIMRKCKSLAIGLAVIVCLAPRAAAQPAIPGAPAAPTPPMPGAAAPAAAGTGAGGATTTGAAPTQVPTIWNKLGITKEGCKACRERCCKSPLGQLLNGITKPLTLMTGGLIGPLCPPGPTQDELAKLLSPDSNASPAEKAAAAIKADEAGAAARRAAVRYLGTVDCHYFPEAEGALISSLRADRNECVRLEAALALGKGCCCTKKTMEALAVAANGSEDGKNPAETSERVKATAMVALVHCLSNVKGGTEPPLPPERPPEGPNAPEAPATAQNAGNGVQLAAYQARLLKGQGSAPLPVDAGRLLAENIGVNPQRPTPTGRRNLFQLIANATTPRVVQEDISFEEAALSLPASPPAGLSFAPAAQGAAQGNPPPPR